MRNTGDSDNKLVSRAVDELGFRLPTSWRTEVEFESARSHRVFDATLRLCAPDGTCGTFIMEAKNRVEPRDVQGIAEQLGMYGRLPDEEEAVPVLVAPFLSLRTRERLEGLGVGYVDLTGNVRVAADRPALFVQATGRSATRDGRSGLRGLSRGRRRGGWCALCAILRRPLASGSWRAGPVSTRGTRRGSSPCWRRKI